MHTASTAVSAQNAPTRKGAPTPKGGPTRKGVRSRGRLFTWPLLFGVVVTVGLIYLSLRTGVYDVDGQADGAAIFQITRIPRTIALVLSGAAMSMCGLVMQLLTQNKFVEPTTTGTTEWAGLGLLLVLATVPNASIVTRMAGAIIFAFVGTMVFFSFLRRVTLRSSLIVPIIGIMLGAVVSSISTFIALKTNLLQSIGVWFAGSFATILKGRYEFLWVIVVVTLIIFISADRLTIAGLGEDIATNVGVNYNRIVTFGTGVIAVATGVVTVVVGNLPFLGLIVPNMVSLVRGDDLRSNLPWVCLVGICLVTVCDLLARTVIRPFEVPVSLILGVLGAVVFVGLILYRRRSM